MVSTARSNVHSAAAHTFKNDLVGNGDFNNVIDGNTGFNQSFGLRNCAREAVKEETVLAVRFFQSFFDQADDDVIADQFTCIHNLLGS